MNPDRLGRSELEETPEALAPPRVEPSTRPIVDDIPEIDLDAAPAQAPRVLVIPERRTRLAAPVWVSLFAMSALVIVSPWSRFFRDNDHPTARSTASSITATEPAPEVEQVASVQEEDAPDALEPTAAVGPPATVVDLQPLDPNPAPTPPIAPAATVRIESPIDPAAPAVDPHPDWPPTPIGALAARDPAPGDTERAWAEIERESERIGAERHKLDAIKPDLLARETIESRQRRLQGRVDFLARLKNAVSQKDGNLEALANEVPRPGDLARDEQARHDALSRSRQVRAAWIARLRALNTPEPAILDEIARAHSMNANARGGPRTRNDALRRAAAELLAVPLDAGAGKLEIARPTARAGRSQRAAPAQPPASSGRSRRRTSG